MTDTDSQNTEHGGSVQVQTWCVVVDGSLVHVRAEHWKVDEHGSAVFWNHDTCCHVAGFAAGQWLFVAREGSCVIATEAKK